MSYYEIFQAVGLISMLIGAVFTFFGWKFHRLLIAIDGFVVGGIVGALIGSATMYYGYDDTLVVFFIIGGIIGAGVFLLLEKIAIGVSIGFIGAVIVGEATKTQIYEGTGWWGISQYATEYNYFAILIGFFVFAYLGWKFYKYAYIILTSASGSFLIAVGGMLSGFWSIFNLWLIALGFFVVGIFIQSRMERSTTFSVE